MKEDTTLTRIAERAADQGRQLVFLQRVLLPVLQVEVQIVEQSREQMSGLEQAALKLCADGFGLPSEVAFGLGLNPNRLGPILTEIQHRGLIAAGKEGRYAVTELGALSLKQGAELLRTRRALLLCGVTGRLMPAAAYEAKRLERRDLAKTRQGVLPESQSITLEHVDLNKIPNKRAVNLPDELLTIEGVVPDSPTPFFLDVIVEVFHTDSRGIECRVHIGRDPNPVTWLTWQQALGTIEPLGFPTNAPERALEQITSELERRGVRAVEGFVDAFGNPRLHILDASNDVLSSRLVDGRGLVLAVGVGELPPIAIYRFQVAGERSDLLRGRTLMVTIAEGTSFARHTRVLRSLQQIQIECRKGRLFGAPRDEHFKRSLEQAGVSLEEARESALLAGMPELIEV